MGSGYWIAECVAAAGCTMVHGTKGGHSQTLATSELSNAEIIVIAPCGFSIERTASELAGLNLLQSAEWQGLDAVKRGRVYVADGNLYFNRSSCGVVETAEMVAEMARPDLKGLWGHHGKHWVALDELEAFCGREGAPPPTKPVAVAEEASRTERREPAAAPAAALKFALPAKHVEHQVELLRAGKFDEAFAMNSAANQARIGSAAKFATVVRSNAAFAALADAANACEVAEVAALNGKRQVEVRVLDLTFAFELSAAGSECATEGYASIVERQILNQENFEWLCTREATSQRGYAQVTRARRSVRRSLDRQSRLIRSACKYASRRRPSQPITSRARLTHSQMPNYAMPDARRATFARTCTPPLAALRSVARQPACRAPPTSSRA